MLSDNIKIIFSLSLSGSALALILFAIKPLIKNRLSKTFQYYIWVIVLVRLMVPYSFDVNIGINNGKNIVDGLFKSVPEIRSASTPQIIDLTQPVSQGQTIHTVNIQQNNFMDYLLIIWALGFTIFLFWNVIVYIRFVLSLYNANIDVLPHESILMRSLIGNRKISMYRNRLAKTPLLIGIFKPVIILPDMKYSDSQLENILLHELMHYKRFDVGIKWIVTIITAVHWFNPVIYLMRSEINNVCELACDEAVIKAMNKEGKQSYGDTLISVVAESRYAVGVVSTTMCEDKNRLKERLIAIMNYKGKTKMVAFLSAVLLIVMAGSAVALGAYAVEKPIIKQSGELYTQSLLDTLIKYKTPYIGDNSKVGSIASNIPAPDARLKYGHIVMQTDVEPYVLTVYYEPMKSNMVIEPEIFLQKEVSSNLVKNAYLLFSLIDNLGEARFCINKPRLQTFTVSRMTYEQYATFEELWADNGKMMLEFLNKQPYIQGGVPINPNGKVMTIEDVKRLSEKADDLSMADLQQYRCIDGGSGIFMLVYDLEDDYTLFVSSVGLTTGKPMSAYLSKKGRDGAIDIRSNDVNEFIKKSAGK